MLLLLLLLGGFAEAKRAAVPPSDCAAAVRKVVLYSYGLRAFCVKNEDCKAFHINPDSCAKPVILRSDAHAHVHVHSDKNLRELQDKARKACEKEWSGRPACSPQVAVPECADGKCHAKP